MLLLLPSREIIVAAQSFVRVVPVCPMARWLPDGFHAM